MTKSRQEIAYEEWQKCFFNLIEVSRNIPDKADLVAYLREMFEYPVIRENLIQAFSNFMWHMDETIERQVNDELEGLIDIIPKLADPENVNTMIIQANLTQMVVAGKQKIDEIDSDEIDELVGDDETDNTPIPL